MIVTALILTNVAWVFWAISREPSEIRLSDKLRNMICQVRFQKDELTQEYTCFIHYLPKEREIIINKLFLKDNAQQMLHQILSKVR